MLCIVTARRTVTVSVFVLPSDSSYLGDELLFFDDLLVSLLTYLENGFRRKLCTSLVTFSDP